MCPALNHLMFGNNLTYLHFTQQQIRHKISKDSADEKRVLSITEKSCLLLS